jgi:hypothetical protein
MQIEARVQPQDTTMLHNVLRSFECALVLIACGYGFAVGWIRYTGTISVCHKNRHLSAKFGQFEWTYIRQLHGEPVLFRLYSHATNVMKDPAVAPAAPKHATVEKVGYVPGVLT